MKTNVTEKAAAKRARRMTSPSTTPNPTTHSNPSDWVWPGLTRAQLREIVIDQIG